jgi:hypothetical protein
MVKNSENKISELSVVQYELFFSPHTYQAVVAEKLKVKSGFFKCMGIMLGDQRHP